MKDCIIPEGGKSRLGRKIWVKYYSNWPEYFMGPLQIVGYLDLYLVTGLPPLLNNGFSFNFDD